MMYILTILLVTLQMTIGLGILCHFKESMGKWSQVLTLSFLLGSGYSSLMVFLLELMHIPINTLHIFLVLLAGSTVIIWSLRPIRNIIGYLSNLKGPNIKLYEFGFLLILYSLLIISFWRTIYLPPYSYDTVVGPDLVALYAVSEGTVNSSIFSEPPYSKIIEHNQLYYAPFTMLLQLTYRLVGLPFGQVWLGILSLCFFTFFYSKCKDYCHPLLAGFFSLLLVITPEYYAYTFILQTDFSNAVFFVTGVIFFYQYWTGSRLQPLWLSALFFCLAVWSRSETIFFLPVGALLVFIKEHKRSTRRALLLSTILMVPSIFLFSLWNYIYVNLYLRTDKSMSEELAIHVSSFPADLLEAFDRMNSVVIFNTNYWGYIVYIFLILLLPNLFFSIMNKKWSSNSILLWIAALYLIFGLLIVTFPAVTPHNTFRRGFFKVIPLLIFFLCCGPFTAWFTSVLKQWEYRKVRIKKIG